MEDSTNPRTQAIAALAELFFESACRSADLAQLESSAIDIGHGCMAEALGLALEALDARLLAQKTEGISVHDVRSRTLATEIGDMGFSLRRYRDRFGEDVYLLADALDIPYGCRSSHAIGRQTAQRRRPACTTSARPSAQAGRALFRGNTPRIALAALIAVALVALVAIAFARCGKDTPENEAAPAVGTAARVSFVAVGDNLPEARITAYADALAGTTGDGDFDFPPSTSRSSRSSRQPTSLTSNRKPISAARR